MTFDSLSIISQLTHAISAQNEEAVESNRLRRKEIKRTITREEAKKDRTKKIHASILKMIGRASAKSLSGNSLTLPEMFSCFINSENVGMAQYELVHQLRSWDSKTLALLRARSKPFTSAISYTLTQAHQATLQFLPFTRSNPFPTLDKTITSSANWFKRRVRKRRLMKSKHH